MALQRLSSQRFLTVDFAINWAMILMVFLSSHLRVPIMPLYVLHLGGRESEIGFIKASFSVAMMLARFVAGKWSERIGTGRVMRVTVGIILVSAAILIRLSAGGLVDRLGRVKIIVPSVLTMALSTLFLTVATGPTQFIVIGAVYGLGTGVLFPVLMALAVDMVGPQESSSAVATFPAASDMGAILGAVVSSLVVAQVSLPAIWIVAAVALGGFAIFLALARGTSTQSQLA